MLAIMSLVYAVVQWGGASAVTVQILSKSAVNQIDDRFLSFTLDAHNLYYGFGSLFDYKNPTVISLAKALSPAFFRVGGTSADYLYYTGFGSTGRRRATPGSRQTVQLKYDQSAPVNVSSFNALAEFAANAGLDLIFGLNERNRTADGTPGGRWALETATPLIKHAFTNKQVKGFELGNEFDINVQKNKTAFDMAPGVIAADFVVLADYLRKVYGSLNGGTTSSPLLLGCDVAVNLEFLEQFAGNLSSSGHASDLGALTWHHYYENGHTSKASDFIRPALLDTLWDSVDQVQQIKAKYLPDAEPILGESSSAYDGGTYGVSDRFASTFWWLDQLGYAAYAGHKAVFRQSFTGSAYQLVQEDAVPNPDYYTAVLWKRLVGNAALGIVGQTARGQQVRSYAFCGRRGNGSVVMTTMSLQTSQPATISVEGISLAGQRDVYLLQGASVGRVTNYTSVNMTLNGQVLALQPDGSLPPMLPVAQAANDPIMLPPLSAAFVEYPNAKALPCM